MPHLATNPTFVEEVQQSFAKQTVMSLIGVELTRVEPGIIEITLAYRPDLTQQHGYVHAGIITTIADSAYTGYPGDGRIFVSAVEKAVRLRTGEIVEAPEAAAAVSTEG